MEKKKQNQETQKSPSKWIKEKEAKFESVREDFVNRKHKKGFRLIVKDIETGSIIMNEAIDVFVGAWAKKMREGCAGASTLISSCNSATLISAIENAEDAIKEAKDQLISGMVKDPEIASELLESILKDVLGGRNNE